MAQPPGLLPAAPGSFIAIDIAADSAAHESWQRPVRVVFRRSGEGWKLVGLDRLPDGKPAAPLSPPAPKAAR
jgi:hypothetical protein